MSHSLTFIKQAAAAVGKHGLMYSPIDAYLIAGACFIDDIPVPSSKAAGYSNEHIDDLLSELLSEGAIYSTDRFTVERGTPCANSAGEWDDGQRYLFTPR